jgi:shikimate kinase
MVRSLRNAVPGCGGEACLRRDEIFRNAERRILRHVSAPQVLSTGGCKKKFAAASRRCPAHV